MAKYFTEGYEEDDDTGTPLYLYLSIHEIRSYRVGPALWTYNDRGHSNINHLQVMTSHTNTLGITFGVDHKTHMRPSLHLNHVAPRLGPRKILGDSSTATRNSGLHTAFHKFYTSSKPANNNLRTCLGLE